MVVKYVLKLQQLFLKVGGTIVKDSKKQDWENGPLVHLDVGQKSFDNENDANSLYYMPAQKQSTLDEHVSYLLLVALNEDRNEFRRIGVAVTAEVEEIEILNRSTQDKPQGQGAHPDSNSDKRFNNDTIDLGSSDGTVPERNSNKYQFEQRLHALRAQNQDLRDRFRASKERTKKKEHVLELKLQEKKLLLESIKRSCIKKRNSTSTQAIRQDFADGIRARAYQKLNGMMQNEDFNTSGYRDLDDTGIPDLQAYAQKMTVSNRNATCRQILTKLWVLLTSISCWVTGHDLVRAGLDVKSIEKHLQEEAKKLQMSNIYNKFDALVAHAATDATRRAASWFPDQKARGYKPGTFKAICRKKGLHTIRGRPAIDLHQELVKPIHSGIQQDWYAAFHLHIPFILQDFIGQFVQHQQDFHQAVAKKYETNSNMAMALNALNNPNGAVRQNIVGLLMYINKAIDSRKSNASQAATPPIAEAMETVYEQCHGSKAKMQRLVKAHIEEIKRTVFRKSVDAMQEHLQNMDRYVAKELETAMNKTHDNVYRTYSNALLHSNKKVNLSPEEVKLKNRLSVILKSVESRFKAEE
ncbi:uncharacterized protein ColSpa_11618 [Colletotrichum spaethianum]|uniref:DUF7605 domain-containing protein n=1 Tax=Colletotrichum spaethianum TaxID=700344 RepID=A0AA37URU9_9PEZI|nr:uncharacterized protein ColSpa_11618 [Colletotrichum spaethianum]GKT51437.1 hypothetical protein ColSpa_11618 [Colletotrichum spaethianum]